MQCRALTQQLRFVPRKRMQREALVAKLDSPVYFVQPVTKRLVGPRKRIQGQGRLVGNEELKKAETLN